MPRALRIVSDAEALALLDIDDAYDAICIAYLEAAANPPVLSIPPALLMRHPARPHVHMKVKGAQSPGAGVAGFRLVADRDTPQGEVSHDFQWLMDLHTAEPVGLVEMLGLHAIRTALTGLVALEALRGPACRTIAVLGAGQIADRLIAPLRNRLAPDRIVVAAARPARAAAFAARHGIEPAATVADAVQHADAVIALTSTTHPILFGTAWRPGMTIVGMGGAHECDVSVLHGADRFIVDDIGFARVSGSLGAWLRAGTLDPATSPDAELGHVLAGTTPGRRSDDDCVFAIVQGMACCDLALAALVHARAAAAGIGRLVPL